MFFILINLLIIGLIIIYILNRIADNSYYYDQKEKKIVNFQAAKKRSQARASEAKKTAIDSSHLCIELGKKCRREK